MLTQSFENPVSQATPEQLREAPRLVPRPHAAPVFGAAKAVEHEVAALNALKALGYLKADSDEFDLAKEGSESVTNCHRLKLPAAAVESTGRS